MKTKEMGKTINASSILILLSYDDFLEFKKLTIYVEMLPHIKITPKFYANFIKHSDFLQTLQASSLLKEECFLCLLFGPIYLDLLRFNTFALLIYNITNTHYFQI